MSKRNQGNDKEDEGNQLSPLKASINKALNSPFNKKLK